MDFQVKVTDLKEQQDLCQLPSPYTNCKNLLTVKQNLFLFNVEKIMHFPLTSLLKNVLIFLGENLKNQPHLKAESWGRKRKTNLPQKNFTVNIETLERY